MKQQKHTQDSHEAMSRGNGMRWWGSNTRQRSNKRQEEKERKKKTKNAIEKGWDKKSKNKEKKLTLWSKSKI
jgi:hypothetical protein